MPLRLTASWAALPRASDQSAYASATATLAAAGTVVTEIRTPTRAPDLAAVSETIPAMPARKAITNDSGSGW